MEFTNRHTRRVRARLTLEEERESPLYREGSKTTLDREYYAEEVAEGSEHPFRRQEEQGDTTMIALPETDRSPGRGAGNVNSPISTSSDDVDQIEEQ